MLRQTFLHIPGIGRKTELSLWSKGICNWEEALDAANSPRFPFPSIARSLTKHLPRAIEAVRDGDAAFFKRLAGFGETWRMYSEFGKDCVFLDIETTGLSPLYHDVTLVGLYDGREYRPFVKSKNLGSLHKVLKKYSVVVTFNGSGFDLPFLRAKLAPPLPPIHIDLRWAAQKLGFRGGLKEIEPRFGIRRPKRLAGIDGSDAVALWEGYCRGDKNALALLVKYNQADVVNLKSLMEQVYQQAATECRQFFPQPARKALAASAH